MSEIKTIFRSAVLSILAILLFPYAEKTEQAPPDTPEPLLLVIEHSEAETEKRGTPVRLKTDAGIIETELEEYLVQVVLSEMPASFEPEALKAQAVAARTFALKKMASRKHDGFDLCTDAACCQAWTGTEELKEKFGEDFPAVWQKASDAVGQTAGEAIYYGGELIEATYFSCSGGITEDAVAVWGAEVPYLQSVISPGEEFAPRYSSDVLIPAAEFAETLRQENAACSFDEKPESWVGGTTYTDGGGVKEVFIGGQLFSGTQLRRIFGLNSTRFDLSCSDGNFLFAVRGFGHRVGMSQYGADNMAKQGFDYRTILQYYYQGVSIEKNNPGQSPGP